MSQQAERPRFLCINEFGVPAGTMPAVRASLAAGTFVDGEEPAVRSSKPVLSLYYTFGPCDLVTIQPAADLRALAVVSSRAPVRHQRAFGVILPEACPQGSLYADWPSIFACDVEKPFLAITQLKIDPLVNLLAGDTIPQRAIERLSSFVQDRFHEFRTAADRFAEEHPGLRKYVEEWAKSSKEDSSRLEMLPLAGLDCSEVVVIIKCSELNSLVRLLWALRSLHLGHLGIEVDAEPLRFLFGKTELPADRIADLPVWAYSSTVVGVGAQLVEDRLALGGALDRIVCRHALLDFRMRALPGSASKSELELARLSSILGWQGAAATADQVQDHVPARFTTLGSYDLLYPSGMVALQRSPGQTIPPPPEVSSATWDARHAARREVAGPRTYTLGQILEVLDEEPPLGAARSENSTSSEGTCGYLQETTIAIRGFPPGFLRPDLLGGSLEAEKIQTAFEQRLRETQGTWLGASYERFRSACSKGYWSYPRTNGALNLVESLITQLCSRHEAENYLDLMLPLREWIRGVTEQPRKRRNEHYTVYNHIDRMMHARSNRESPFRQPGVSRAFEARAGYVLPRDAFHAYLCDVVRLRLQDRLVPLLVDGVDGELRVKDGARTSIFYVSALRLHNPLLWPVLAHEVEHVRYWHERAPNSVAEAAQWLARSHGGTFDDPEHPHDGTMHGIVQRIQDLAERGIFSREAKWISSGIVEVGCDLAVWDSGVLGANPTEIGFFSAMWPNAAMDLHESWRGGHTLTKDRERKLLKDRAYRQGVRLAGSLALMRLGRGVSGPSAEEAIREQLRTVLSEPLWTDALRELLNLSCGSRRGMRNPDWTHAAEDQREIADCVTRVGHELRGILSGRRRSWPQMLAIVNAYRSSSSVEQLPEAVVHVARFCEDVRNEANWSDIAAICRDVFPRGGFGPGSRVVTASSRDVSRLLHALRRTVRRERMEAVGALLAGPTRPANMKDSAAVRHGPDPICVIQGEGDSDEI